MLQASTKKPIKKVSDKKRSQLKDEKAVHAQVIERSQGLCERCGCAPDFRGLSVHHKVFRSQGGKSTIENQVALCGACHSLSHHITETRSTTRPYSKEMQLHRKLK